MMEQVLNNIKNHRFELKVDGEVAFIDYHLDLTHTNKPVYVLVHTEVPPALGGKGIGSQLVKETLENITQEGATVRSRCSFITAYLQRNPQYKDIIAP